MSVMTRIMGVSIEIFDVKTKYQTSYFLCIEKGDAQYVGLTYEKAFANAESLVMNYLLNSKKVET